MTYKYLFLTVFILSISAHAVLAQSLRDSSLIEKILAQQKNVPAQPARGLNQTALPTGVIYLPDTLIETNDGLDTARYSFSYNNLGLMTCGKIEKSGAGSVGKWVNFEMDSCTYDKNGNRLSTMIKTWVNGQWTYRQGSRESRVGRNERRDTSVAVERKQHVERHVFLSAAGRCVY